MLCLGIKSVSKLTYQEESWRKTIKEQLFLQNLLLLLVANKGFNLKESGKTSLLPFFVFDIAQYNL